MIFRDRMYQNSNLYCEYATVYHVDRSVPNWSIERRFKYKNNNELYQRRSLAVSCDKLNWIGTCFATRFPTEQEAVGALIEWFGAHKTPASRYL